MPPNPCPCCGHGNPADAMFCSACGVQVNLLPCPSCGAVNNNMANNCHQCERPLPGRATELPDAAPPAAPVLQSASDSSARRTFGGFVLVLIAALTLFAYTRFSVDFFGVPKVIERTLQSTPSGQLDPALPGTPGGDEAHRSAPATAGLIERKGATEDVVPAKLNKSVPPASSAQVIPAKVVPDAPAPAAASPSLVDPRGAGLRPALPASQEACTEAMTALGLCGAKDASAPAARAQAEDARKAAGGAELPRQQGCTEAAAALGLCVVNQPSRRE